MANANTTRRAMLGATVAIPAVAGIIASAAIAENSAAQDAELLAQWERRNALMRENLSDWGDIGPLDEEPRYTALCDKLDATETFIERAKPATLAGVEIQLWLAFAHCDTTRGADRALAHGRTDEIIASVEDLDFEVAMIVRAIMALRQMRGA